ncbi:LOW QUALITY PROTEIN: transmembrane protein 88B [Choloepus didactylus]|uniref:LOW QUALITY PROTEIN: transmembrane protein 88B n=1 Tax=Choloepus didactylus TaxID=27675 RepID=UPI00189C8D97|nr:LOW QUALITY PROTEIN: transmembrane protein 88B [Choloepus didactylus]
MSETEEDEGGGASDTAPLLPQRPPDRQASALLAAGWAGLAAQGLGPLLLPGRALAWLLLHLLPTAVSLLLLLPAAAIVYLGFLCHSRVRPAPRPACRALLSDGGSAALIVLGFLALPPLLVLASAARARLARRLATLLPPPARDPRPRRPPGPGDAGREDGRPNGEELRRAWV